MSTTSVEIRPEQISPRLRHRLAARVEELVAAEDFPGAREKLRAELEGHRQRIEEAERGLGASTLDGSGPGPAKEELDSARQDAHRVEAATRSGRPSERFT
jgi:hypothetical protein